jgi:hypothetical protein
VLLPLSLALASVLQASTPLTNADLRLVATAPTRVLVGEFVTVRTAWTVLRRIEAPCDPAEQGLVEIDRGHGFVAHIEAHQAIVCVFRAPESMAPGRLIRTEHIVGLESHDAPAHLSGLDAVNASLRFVFDRPGRYRLRARFDQATSNVIEIEAVAPVGAGLALLDALRARPIVLTLFASAEPAITAEGEALVAIYGRHRLLQPFPHADDRQLRRR